MMAGWLANARWQKEGVKDDTLVRSFVLVLKNAQRDYSRPT